MQPAYPIVHRAWKTRDHAAPLRMVRPSAIDQIIADIAPDGCHRVVLVGPIVSDQRSAGVDMPPCYFVTMSADDEPFVSIQGARTRREAVELRDAVMTRLIRHRPALAVHCFDDELALATWAESVWPCATTRAIRKQVEAERRRN
jgi:hypothetical protein